MLRLGLAFAITQVGACITAFLLVIVGVSLAGPSVHDGEVAAMIVEPLQAATWALSSLIFLIYAWKNDASGWVRAFAALIHGSMSVCGALGLGFMTLILLNR